MKIAFTKQSVDDAPKTFARVRLIEEEKGTKRLARDAGITTIEIGIGSKKELTKRAFIILCRSIIRFARASKIKKLAFSFAPTLPPEWVAQTAAENAEMANFEFNIYKSKPKGGWNEVEEILICGIDSKAVEAAAKRGQEMGKAVNACRTLANTPGGEMTPRMLAKAAKTAVAGTSVRVQSLTRPQIEKLGMGAVLGVAKGSSEEPAFIVMEYRPQGDTLARKGVTLRAKSGPIVLIGKGVTFDSGGLNIKNDAGMYEMHMDMSGAAAVIHTVALAAKQKLPVHLVGLIPAVENMPGGAALRPGDILKSLSGKTIEVLNTDAEGRLILADAITYAKRFKPAVVIDVATLTGAAMVALGTYASGLMTRDDTLAEKLLAIGEESGDYLWRLPLWDEFEEGVKGTFADVKNVSGNNSQSRYGGASNGGIFLWQFAKELDCPWAHLDIAPRMTANDSDELAQGAAGAPVRLLISYIRDFIHA